MKKKYLYKKYYNKNDNLFHIDQYEINKNEKDIVYSSEFKSLNSFIKAIGNDFTNVNLYHYIFNDKEINYLRKYDLTKVILSAKQQRQFGIYNDSFRLEMNK